MSKRGPHRAASWPPRWIDAALILLVGAAMLRWSWLTWPDVLIDFGRELYVPWRLSLGEALYRDLAYFNPPLSPYLNALWFSWFGVGIQTVVFCNLAILAGIVALLYTLLSAISDRWSATIACLVFLLLFAFGQLVLSGNYNFICPYSHEMTHGLFLSLVGFWWFFRFLRSGQRIFLAAAGLSLGGVFLTKAEVFLATALALAAGLALRWMLRRPGRKRVGQETVMVIGMAGIPPLIAWVFLCQAMPPDVALKGILGPWPFIVHGQVQSLTFYRRLAGFSGFGANLKLLICWTACYAAAGLVLASLSLGVRRFRARIMMWAGIVSGVIAVSLFEWSRQAFPGNLIFEGFRPLPLVMGILGVSCLRRVLRERGREGQQASGILRVLLIVWAGALLAKMLFNVHIYQYGFALAMPATLLLVLAVVTWVPQALEARQGQGQIFRVTGVALLLILVMGNLGVVALFFEEKTYRVAAGADSFLASSDRATEVQELVAYLGEQGTGRETLVVLPEGVIVNYLTRRINPTPYSNFLPPEVLMFGEERIVAALREAPPDYVAIIHRDTQEYGFPFFGRDYGQKIDEWISAHYDEVRLIGARPLRGNQFGILLLRRDEGVDPTGKLRYAIPLG